MAPEHWSRIERLFDQACGLEAADRRAFLEASCGEDDPLREEVDSLLAAHEGAGSFLRRPALESVPPAVPETLSEPWTGRRIGPYTVVREIGRGGMGRVLLAERTDREYRGRVAVKVVDAPVAARGLLDRFRRERQILADLDHPNIARLLDAGTLPEGLPYLVMEHVDGVPIDAYCDQERLGVEERIRLFREVCEAVQYAHRHLVVHRDLKPDNVLVTPEGRPKLLDFGIAKLLQSDADGALTRTHHLPMTPRYASPEQVQGRAVGTGTDVYSLGVLLYELLAGQSPYELDGGTVPEVMRRVLEDRPRRPSAATSEEAALARRTGLRQLRRRLEGDLDTIALTALRKDPERRYPSVQQLSDDLRRHLDDIPISARPDSVTYRARKFWRRNRIAASLGAALASSLLVFATVVAAQGRQAAQERDKAEQALDFLVEVFRAFDPLSGKAAAGADAVTARELLAAGARRASTELAEEPRIQAPILHSIGKAHHGLGLYREAIPLLEQAAELYRRQLGPSAPETLEALAILAEARAELAEFSEAESLFRQVVAARRHSLGAAHPETLAAVQGLALTLSRQDRLDEAGAILAEALRQGGEALGEDAPELGGVYQALSVLHRARGDRAGHLHYARRAYEVWRAVHGQDHPLVAEALNNLGVALYEQGRIEEAVASYRKAREIWLPILEEYHPHLLANLASLAAALRELGRYDQAEPLYRELLQARVEQVGLDHPTTVAVLKNYAELESDIGRFEAALRHRTRLLSINERLFSPPHLYREWSRSELGVSFREVGDLERAEALQEEALAGFQEIGHEDHPAAAQPLLELARLALLRGDVAAAEARALEAVGLLRRLLPPGHPDLAEAVRVLGAVRLAQGRHAQAEPLLLSGLVNDEGEPVVHGTRRLAALRRLVELYRALGRPAAADRYAREVVAVEADLRRYAESAESLPPLP